MKKFLLMMVVACLCLSMEAAVTVDYTAPTLTVSSTSGGEISRILNAAKTAQDKGAFTDPNNPVKPDAVSQADWDLLIANMSSVTAYFSALQDANLTTLKLVGTFNAEDMNLQMLNDAATAGYGATISVLDFKEANWGITTMNQVGSNYRGQIKKVIVSDYATAIGYQCFTGFDKLEEIVLPTGLTSIDDGAFMGCNKLSKVNFKDCQNLTSIGANAFERTALTELDLTGMPNLKTIGDEAFKNITTLITVKFDTTLESLGSMVFRESKSIKDVYVNYVEGTNGEITCPKGCFDFDTTVKQTSEAGTQNAILHYPENKYEFYVHAGNKPVFYTQADLNTLKDQALVASNGWQEFISTGIVVEEGWLLQTYSSPTAQRCPVYQTTGATTGTTPHVFVYIVSGYADNKTTLTLLEKKSDREHEGDASSTYYYYQIPANTGVIIYTNVAGSIVMAPDRENPSPINETTSVTINSNTYVNYLVPLCGETDTPIKPADTSGNVVTYRNFSLCKLSETDLWQDNGSQTDYWAFFRLKKVTVPAGTKKAYLHYPASLYSDGNGNLADNDADWRNQSTQANGIQLFFEEEETTGITTPMIVNVNEQNDVIYTLQGLRVEKATTPGIYIKNGKKFLIK